MPAFLYVVESAFCAHSDGGRLSLWSLYASGWKRDRHQRAQRRNGRVEGHGKYVASGLRVTQVCFAQMSTTPAIDIEGHTMLWYGPFAKRIANQLPVP